jgi:pimeloyl-ACP methyl ester carboxylesterase
MSAKLAQTIAIGYYRTKIKALKLVSTQKAVENAFALFCTPYSGKPRRKQPPIFKKAQKITTVFNGLKIYGWVWQPVSSNGQQLMICHGFDSCSYKFAHFVMPFLKQGFQVFAFDAQGHGLSDGKLINARDYRDFMLHANQEFGDMQVMMGHSLGGLALSLAAEQLPLLQKMILIAPATETQTAIQHFFNFLKLPIDLIVPLQQHVETIAGKPIQWFSVKRAVSNIHIPILWIHDQEDPICPFADVEPLLKQAPLNIQWLVTNGWGHSRIYRENKVKKAIEAFTA